MAFDAATPGVTTIIHCLIVPEFWAGMQGDDWLNNARTRDAFGDYLEKLLENEAKDALSEVESLCRAQGIAYRSATRLGEPTAEALAVAIEVGADLCVIGPPRHKGEAGLRSRMNLDRLVRHLPCPLLIAAPRSH